MTKIGIDSGNQLLILKNMRYFRHLKVSWVKVNEIPCLFIFTSIYALARLKGLAVEMYRMKRLLN